VSERYRLPRPARFCIALAYVQGEKCDYIAARFGVSRSDVAHTAKAFGLPRRGHRPAEMPDERTARDVLAATAKRAALACETDAKVWRALARRAISDLQPAS